MSTFSDSVIQAFYGIDCTAIAAKMKGETPMGTKIEGSDLNKRPAS